MELHNFITLIQERLAGKVLSVAEMKNDDVMITTDREHFAEVVAILKNNSSFRFSTLMNQSGADYTDTLAVMVNLYSGFLRRKVTVKAFLQRENPEIDSLVPLFRGIDWYERETFDMFGIRFLGHPNLKRLLLPDDWEGYPLRKDYVYPHSYNGMETGRADLLDVDAAGEAHV
ncbi:MAG TPA: NADH-quinone oxidoreductase subunit C [Nitrospirota bacterium]|nr:NADH-quinone oxidoreductase subunit C [Nitrospirota bacterium]